MNNITHLLESVNTASVSARRSWIFFMALMAYFAIAVTSVTHEQLLLDAPLMLPLLQVPMPVTSFFFFSPIFLVGVHTIMLLQHAALAEKVYAWDEALAEYEKNDLSKKKETDVWRKSLSTYFYTQASSSAKGKLFSMGLRSLIMWITITFAPLLLILYFQAAFLAYHDPDITWAHRSAAGADLLLLFMLAFTTRFDNLLGKGKKWLNGLMRGAFAVAWLVLTALSFLVLTIPGEPIDKALASWEWMHTRVPMHLEDWEWKAKGERYAFWPTAFLFEGQVNYETGKSTTWFGLSRNLIVPDKMIVADKEYKLTEISLSLRGRDLRYATFDRSNLRNADFTAAKMTAISMKGADLRRSRFGCAEQGKPPSWRPRKQKNKKSNSEVYLKPIWRDQKEKSCSEVSHADLTGANLENAVIEEANFTQADLTGANLKKIKSLNAIFYRAILTKVNLQFARLTGAYLVGANLYEANLTRAMVWDANLSISSLVNAKLDGADMWGSNLTGANFSGASLFGTYLPSTKLSATNFLGSKIWWTKLPGVSELNLTSIGLMELKPPTESQWKILKGSVSEFIAYASAKPNTTLLNRDNGTIDKKWLNSIPSETTAVGEWKNSNNFKAWEILNSSLTRENNENYTTNLVRYMGEIACLHKDKKLAIPILLNYAPTYYDVGGYDPDLGGDQLEPVKSVYNKTHPDKELESVLTKMKEQKIDMGGFGSYEYWDVFYPDDHQSAFQLYARLTGKNCPNRIFIPDEYMKALKKAAKPPKNKKK